MRLRRPTSQPASPQRQHTVSPCANSLLLPPYVSHGHAHNDEHRCQQSLRFVHDGLRYPSLSTPSTAPASECTLPASPQAHAAGGQELAAVAAQNSVVAVQSKSPRRRSPIFRPTTLARSTRAHIVVCGFQTLLRALLSSAAAASSKHTHALRRPWTRSETNPPLSKLSRSRVRLIMHAWHTAAARTTIMLDARTPKPRHQLGTRPER